MTLSSCQLVNCLCDDLVMNLRRTVLIQHQLVQCLCKNDSKEKLVLRKGLALLHLHRACKGLIFRYLNIIFVAIMIFQTLMIYLELKRRSSETAPALLRHAIAMNGKTKAFKRQKRNGRRKEIHTCLEQHCEDLSRCLFLWPDTDIYFIGFVLFYFMLNHSSTRGFVFIDPSYNFRFIAFYQLSSHIT